MARQLQSSYTGTVGNLTFYKLYNQYYVRAKSSGGIQTEATKACQQPFAMASTIAAAIRRILQPAISYPANKEMQNRLVKAVLQWLRTEASGADQSSSSLSALQGFQFVSQTSLQQLLLIDIQVFPSHNNSLTVVVPSFIPKQHIIAPPATKQVELYIASGSYNLHERKITSANSTLINVPYTSKAIAEQTIVFPGLTLPQHFVATAASVSYKTKQPGSQSLITVQQHQWKASSIIDVRHIETHPSHPF